MSLIEKIKKSRQVNVAAGGFNFIVRRPTDMEAAYMRGQDLKQGDLLEKFVIDWAGVTELDIIPGGSCVDVPFDSELFMDWVADRPDLWAPLSDAILDAYTAHRQKMEDTLGELGAG